MKRFGAVLFTIFLFTCCLFAQCREVIVENEEVIVRKDTTKSGSGGACKCPPKIRP